MMEILVERIIVDRKCYFNIHRKENTDEYIIRGYVYNRQIYGRRFDRRFFNAYKEYIKQRLIYISELNLYTEDYTMIEIGNRIYKRISKNLHFMELIQYFVPVDYEIDDECIEIDLLTDCKFSDGVPYADDILLFKFDAFYHMGNKLATLQEVLDNVDGVDRYDLKYGIPELVLRYLTSKYYSPDFKLYITDEVTVRIDKWY